MEMLKNGIKIVKQVFQICLNRHFEFLFPAFGLPRNIPTYIKKIHGVQPSGHFFNKLQKYVLVNIFGCESSTIMVLRN